MTKNIPSWVLKHFESVKENNGVCDIPGCVCHWVDSLKDPKVKAAWYKKGQDWLGKWEQKR